MSNGLWRILFVRAEISHLINDIIHVFPDIHFVIFHHVYQPVNDKNCCLCLRKAQSIVVRNGE